MWMKDGDGFFTWAVTVKSSCYNDERGGWDYTVIANDGQEHLDVPETKLKSAY